MELIEAKLSKEPEKRSYSKLHHIEIHPVKGPHGGYKVMHHRQSEGMNYHAPQEHLFGKGEGKAMMAHVAQAMGIRDEEPSADERD